EAGGRAFVGDPSGRAAHPGGGGAGAGAECGADVGVAGGVRAVRQHVVADGAVRGAAADGARGAAAVRVPGVRAGAGGGGGAAGVNRRHWTSNSIAFADLSGGRVVRVSTVDVRSRMEGEPFQAIPKWYEGLDVTRRPAKVFKAFILQVPKEAVPGERPNHRRQIMHVVRLLVARLGIAVLAEVPNTKEAGFN